MIFSKQNLYKLKKMLFSLSDVATKEGVVLITDGDMEVGLEVFVDGNLAMHLMGTQAIKGVEIGLGFDTASLPGSKVMDEITYEENDGIKRKTNNLGGIEGGMTTGEEIIIRCVMKPIPTLYKPLDTINVNTLEKYKASVERSDS